MVFFTAYIIYIGLKKSNGILLKTFHFLTHLDFAKVITIQNVNLLTHPVWYLNWPEFWNAQGQLVFFLNKVLNVKLHFSIKRPTFHHF